MYQCKPENVWLPENMHSGKWEQLNFCLKFVGSKALDPWRWNSKQGASLSRCMTALFVLPTWDQVDFGSLGNSTVVFSSTFQMAKWREATLLPIKSSIHLGLTPEFGPEHTQAVLPRYKRGAGAVKFTAVLPQLHWVVSYQPRNEVAVKITWSSWCWDPFQ